MPSNVPHTYTPEVAHVLFLDILGYSTMPMEAQMNVVSEMYRIVRATDQFQQSRSADQLISLPTGDGMVLVFFDTPESALRCASEISHALHNHPKLLVRMGVHTGPVYRFADINTNVNVAGGGINMAQRIMDCGDGGHVLVSSSVLHALDQSSEWIRRLHDLGEVEVKHGFRISVLNLYTDEVGNPATPNKIHRELVRLAIVFVDIVGSTALSVEAGDVAFDNALREFFDRSSRLIHVYNGANLKIIGDSYLATFSDAKIGLDFAIEIHQSLSKTPIEVAGRPLAVRIGIHVGEVYSKSTSFGDDIFGNAINIAARISTIAEQDQIVISNAVRKSLSKEQISLIDKTEYQEIKGVPGLAEIGRLTIGRS